MNKRQDIQQKSRLGTLLIHKGFITRQQLDEALTIQSAEGKRLGEVLLQKGWLTEKQLSGNLFSLTPFSRRCSSSVCRLLLLSLPPPAAPARRSRPF